MKIVIDAGSLFRDYESVEMDRFFTDCLIRLIRSNPQSAFWVLDSPFFRNKDWSGTAVQFISKRSWLPGQLGENWLSGMGLRSAIRRQMVDGLLSIGRSRIQVPGLNRFFWIPAEAEEVFIKKNAGILKRIRFDRNFLIIDSQMLKSKLVREHALPEEKIFVVPLAFSENYISLAWADKEQTKVKYAAGKEYFLTRANFPEKDLLTLLRAFSIFKKKQQSNMNLLIAGLASEPDNIPHDKLETYKYRHDVHAYAGLSKSEFVKMTGSAYALVQPVSEVRLPSILNAFQAGIPVISGAGAQLEQSLNEAILKADPGNVEILAEGMIALFTNESMRMELIRKGTMEAGRFNIEQSATSLSQALQLVEK